MRGQVNVISLFVVVGCVFSAVAEAEFGCGDVVTFENGIPYDWQVFDIDGEGVVWQISDGAFCQLNNQTGGDGMAACVDARVGANTLTVLRTPIFSLEGLASARLEFRGAMEDIDNGDYLVSVQARGPWFSAV